MDENKDPLVCIDCLSGDNLVRFPCSHNYCQSCVIRFNYSKLLSLESSLKADMSSVQGKSSFYSCNSSCDESKFSIKYPEILNFLDNSSLSADDKSNFISLSKAAEPYFNGLVTYFYTCERCKAIKSHVTEKICVCLECISELCSIQSGQVPKRIKYIDGKPKSEISFSEFANFEFCLLELMSSISCFDFVSHEGNVLQIHKMKVLKDNMEVLLTKPRVKPQPNNDVIEINDFPDLCDIGSYKIRLK